MVVMTPFNAGRLAALTFKAKDSRAFRILGIGLDQNMAARKQECRKQLELARKKKPA